MTREETPGLGIDAEGGPVVDPTENVKALSEAANQRQDDLRAWLEKYIEARVDGRAALSNERYRSIMRELEAIELRRIEHKKDTKETVDTAFAVAEKAITKSETNTADKIKSVESTVSDLKDRVLRLETTASTKTEGRGENRAGVGMIIGIIGTVFGLLSLLLLIANFVTSVSS